MVSLYFYRQLHTSPSEPLLPNSNHLASVRLLIHVHLLINCYCTQSRVLEGSHKQLEQTGESKQSFSSKFLQPSLKSRFKARTVHSIVNTKKWYVKIGDTAIRRLIYVSSIRCCGAYSFTGMSSLSPSSYCTWKKIGEGETRVKSASAASNALLPSIHDAPLSRYTRWTKRAGRQSPTRAKHTGKPIATVHTIGQPVVPYPNVYFASHCDCFYHFSLKPAKPLEMLLNPLSNKFHLLD